MARVQNPFQIIVNAAAEEEDNAFIDDEVHVVSETEDNSENEEELDDALHITEEEKRNRWSLDDSLTLVESVLSVGQGDWARVMELCHAKHKCTKYTKKEQFRKHFNTLSNKKNSIWKPYTCKSFTALRGTPKEKALRDEQEHNKKHKEIEKQRDKIQAHIHTILEREKQKSTEDRIQLNKAKRELQEKAEERRKVKEERLEKYEEEAKKEHEFRNKVMGFVDKMPDVLAQATHMETLLMEYLMAELEDKKRRQEKKEKKRAQKKSKKCDVHDE